MTDTSTQPPLAGRVALVAGATRGAGRAIAIELGAAGATVYATGRTTRGRPSPMARPETIEETAELVDAAGGTGIAVRVAHTRGEEVAALVARIAAERDGRLDVLVNDVWGGDPLTQWRPFWDRRRPDRPRAGAGAAPARIAAVAVSPGFLRSEAMLDHFGVTEATWRDAIATDRHFAASETPRFVARGIAALAADPDVMDKTGQALGSWHLARAYGVRDVDGSRPDWGEHVEREVLPELG
jgi:NAD(P)-dependent dehydrogenase (short-subunit alcohol dehydrogenase family)